MKRILSLCAAIALALTAIVGCEPKAENAAENALENTENAVNEMENNL
ncbi:MAG: hypothetical protein WD873_03085 [Candidatus Hydrogenedentales bacterium]